jgi:HAD superfamily hydrolase (TIGR01509 family)
VIPAAVLFDAGGTLVLQDPVLLGERLQWKIDAGRAFEAHYRAMNAYARHRLAGADPGWVWWQEHYYTTLGVPEPQLAPARADNGYGLWSMPIAGAVETVRRLAELGIRVAVVSNSDGSVRESLGRAGFEGLLEFVVDSHEVGVAKPDPGIFHYALARLGVEAQRAWYVGDSLFHDIGGAAAAGMASAVLLDPLGLVPEHEPRLAAIADLLRLLAED